MTHNLKKMSISIRGSLFLVFADIIAELLQEQRVVQNKQ